MRLINTLTPKSAWVFFFLPEVKDRSLEEIDEMVSLTPRLRRQKMVNCDG